MNKEPQRIFYRIPEVAEMLTISRSALYVMIQAGDIPVVRFGRSVRISASALHAWLEQQQGSPVRA